MPDRVFAAAAPSSADGERLGEAGAPPPPPAIDLAHLGRYTFGDLELQREVLGLFAGQLTASLDELRAADTADAWRRAAHTLKGSSHAIGATALAEAMQNAESLPDTTDEDARLAALGRIEAEVHAVEAFLSSQALI